MGVPFEPSRIRRKNILEKCEAAEKDLPPQVGTDAKGSHWFVRGHEWNGSRPRTRVLERLFAVCQQELRDEKAPLFGVWRACRDNDPAF